MRTDIETKTIARLETVAAVRALITSQPRVAEYVVRNSDNPAELAESAVGMAYSLLRLLLPSDKWELILGALTEASTAQGDGK